MSFRLGNSPCSRKPSSVQVPQLFIGYSLPSHASSPFPFCSLALSSLFVPLSFFPARCAGVQFSLCIPWFYLAPSVMMLHPFLPITFPLSCPPFPIPSLQQAVYFLPCLEWNAVGESSRYRAAY